MLSDVFSSPAKHLSARHLPAKCNRLLGAIRWCLPVSILFISACTSAPVLAPATAAQEYRASALAEQLPTGELRTRLLTCQTSGFTPTPFSIAHRGAPLGYPEHTREGYMAAAAMGAGLIECDVTFTRDKTLVCRHSQCDLHRTTNVLGTPLAEKCSAPFTPATAEQAASARCCTSDFTLQEFRSLCGRADHVDPNARSVADYLKAPVSPVTGTLSSCGTLLTHRESIRLIDDLGADFVPELKGPQVSMPFHGLTQIQYAEALINEYTQEGIDLERVHPQSFNLADVLYWVRQHPELADRAVYLDGRPRDPDFQPTLAGMKALFDQGVRVVAPPIPALLRLNPEGKLEPTDYARLARAAGLSIITWTFEAGRATDPGNWVYANLPGFMTTEGRMLEVLEALARDVGVVGVFSDWPGTVTYYANCSGI